MNFRKKRKIGFIKNQGSRICTGDSVGNITAKVSCIHVQHAVSSVARDSE